MDSNEIKKTSEDSKDINISIPNSTTSFIYEFDGPKLDLKIDQRSFYKSTIYTTPINSKLKPIKKESTNY